MTTRDRIAAVLRENLMRAIHLHICLPLGKCVDCKDAIGPMAAALADRLLAAAGVTMREPRRRKVYDPDNQCPTESSYMIIDDPPPYKPDPEADGDDIPDEMRG